MKYNSILILLFLSVTAFSQDFKLPYKNGKVYYEQDYILNGNTKKALYLKSKNVLLQLFPKSMGSAQSDEKENGFITVKGYASYKFPSGLFITREPQKIDFNLTIVVEDNKYKIDIYNFYVPIYNKVEQVPIESSYFMIKTKDNSYFKNRKMFDKMVKNVFNSVQNEMQR